MDQFLVSFKDKWHLREQWESQFASGMFFLATEEPFERGQEFNLIFRVENPQVGVIIPSRVLQILPAQPKHGKGMVIEYISYETYRQKLNALIADLDDQKWTGLEDFSDFSLSKPKSSLGRDVVIQKVRRFLDKTADKNFYEMLAVDPASSAKKIQESYFKWSRDFHPDSQSIAIDDELSALLDAAYQRVTQAYAILKDRKERSRYDSELGILVRNIDESPSEFKIRKLQSRIEHSRDQNRDSIDKAERLYQEALAAERKGEKESALKNLKLALLHNPDHAAARQKKIDLDQK